jgi:hypothetical protein
MFGLINLHHFLMSILFGIAIFVFWILGRTLYFFTLNKEEISSDVKINSFLSHSQAVKLEIV